MQKKAQGELVPRKNTSNQSSQIQPNEEIINFISLSHYQMHKLVHDNENFHKKVKTIINQSKKQIELAAYKEALSLLSEGEKILQYAAGSGKTIERELIVCVLHNIATAYHKLWMIEKCVRYIQGLIFNLENHLNSLQNSVMSSNQKQQIMVAMQGLQMKHMLAAYNIRFCALNSQQNYHKEALVSAKKAIGYVRSIILFDEQQIRGLFKQQKQKEAVVDLKYRLLIEILEFQSNFNIKKQKQILKATHFSLQIWNKSKQKTNTATYSNLKTYSIGDFMDLKPKEYCSKSQMINSVLKKGKDFEQTIYYKLLLLSISLFSTSTELRLNQTQINFFSQFDRESTVELIQAQIYNLLAIIVISAFMPFQILYLKHLLNSYSNYFNTELSDYKTVEQQSYEKIIELISDNKYKSPMPGSTQIISSQEFLPQLQSNQYKLKDKFMEKNKINRKNFHKSKKDLDRNQNKKSNSKVFSNLETKSVIKSEKTNSKTKQPNKIESKLKSKSKPKSKSKTLEKKSKEKDKLYFVKVTSSKSKKKYLQEELVGLLKRVSPKRAKEGTIQKQLIGSDIIGKPRKKSLLNHRISSKKGLLTQNKSPKRRNNVYGLNY